uniref:Uncharacterized protein n=1 Tax=Timema genevievae TaxID=629358 RepID=A0A7R9JT07_TIMGE|nr:unnamed protein product [Timema genevievae]
MKTRYGVSYMDLLQWPHGIRRHSAEDGEIWIRMPVTSTKSTASYYPFGLYAYVLITTTQFTSTNGNTSKEFVDTKQRLVCDVMHYPPIINTPDPNSNLGSPRHRQSSLVYCESSALDHAATEGGSVEDVQVLLINERTRGNGGQRGEIAPSYPSTPPSDITESEEIWPVAPSYPSTPSSDITESEEIWQQLTERERESEDKAFLHKTCRSLSDDIGCSTARGRGAFGDKISLRTPRTMRDTLIQLAHMIVRDVSSVLHSFVPSASSRTLFKFRGTVVWNTKCSSILRFRAVRVLFGSIGTPRSYQQGRCVRELLWRREVILKCKEVLYFVPNVTYTAETWTMNNFPIGYRLESISLSNFKFLAHLEVVNTKLVYYYTFTFFDKRDVNNLLTE